MSATASPPVPAPHGATRRTACRFPDELVRVYVWEWPVRVCHWAVVVSIVVLSATGILIGTPLLSSAGEAGRSFTMGWIRTTHFFFAILFALAVLSRVVWMFRGNIYSHWDKYLPVRAKRRRALWKALSFYLFRLRKPPGFVGHNPLAGFTYTLVFTLYFVMIATGFALYSSQAAAGSPMRAFRFLIPVLGGLQTARLVHHVVMWLLLGFAVHHVYSSVLMSQIEANATTESMFSGYKFVPCEDLVYSGYRFVDHKDVWDHPDRPTS